MDMDTPWAILACPIFYFTCLELSTILLRHILIEVSLNPLWELRNSIIMPSEASVRLLNDKLSD